MGDQFERFEIDLNAKCVCGCMEGNRIHKIYRFPNHYGASAVSGPKQKTKGEGNFRIYVLRFEALPPDNCWEIAQDTPITDDTVECEDWTQVEKVLVEVMALPVAELGVFINIR